MTSMATWSCAVVGGSGCGGPEIEVPADHNDLILQLWICAGNLRDGVEAVFVSPVNSVSTSISMETGTFAFRKR